MTVQSTNNRVDSLADGITIVFPYDYYLLVASHMKVFFDGVNQPTGWNVDGVGNPGGGNVVFSTPPLSNVVVTLLREVPLTQETNYTEYDSFPAETHEAALDLGVMRDQQFNELHQRQLHYTIGDKPNAGTELPAPMPFFVIGYDLNGDLVNVNVGADAGGPVRNPLTEDLRSKGFRFIGSDTNDATLIIIDGQTGIIEAGTDVTVPAGSLEAHLPDADIHYGDAPADAGQYVRVDNNWELVDIPPGTIISDTPPVDPLPSQLWFQSSTGIEWIWYEDGSSNQWVETGPSPVGNLTDNTGAVQAFAAVVPEGWLACNGAAVSRTAYANLFTYLGTLYGIGDGSTTFNVPDLRGEFVRGFDDGKGTDSGRVLGSGQVDDFGSHDHGSVGGGGESYVITPGGAGNLGNSGGITYGQRPETALTGGAETRPVNVAMNYGIKT